VEGKTAGCREWAIGCIFLTGERAGSMMRGIEGRNWKLGNGKLEIRESKIEIEEWRTYGAALKSTETVARHGIEEKGLRPEGLSYRGDDGSRYSV
jgi:hypothetical protein